MDKKIMKNKLKILREKKGLLQKDIAETLRIDVNTYGQYERCQRKIPSDCLLNLSNLLDVSVNEIFSRKLPERYIEVSADDKKFIMQYQNLNDADKSTIFYLVERLSSEKQAIRQTYGMKAASRSTEDSSEENTILQKKIQDFQDAEDFSDD